MSRITQEDLEELRRLKERHDDEGFHSEFDRLLEQKLAELDPEWVEAMLQLYEESGMSRWCA